jgi:hypothetical protein
MSQGNERLRAAERFLESLLAGKPEMTFVTEDFEYEPEAAFLSESGSGAGVRCEAFGAHRPRRGGMNPGLAEHGDGGRSP